MTIDEILAKEEGQTFDRKSINKKATDLSDIICALSGTTGTFCYRAGEISNITHQI